ncbi:uncharacterized protein BKA78DRAFT_136320 [Phyllosticta capitalensis]|uniref:uncharacterized protein n=1 Tax=Phyllosticta capitalensis TaxID=121624 RepID=UPI00312D68DC
MVNATPFRQCFDLLKIFCLAFWLFFLHSTCSKGPSRRLFFIASMRLQAAACRNLLPLTYSLGWRSPTARRDLRGASTVLTSMTTGFWSSAESVSIQGLCAGTHKMSTSI